MTKPLLMGIVNATPDSFYDGNPQNNLPTLLAKCKDYADGGVDIFDIGGESTRPSAAPVPAEEELNRVLPLIKEVRKTWPKIPVSLDTVKIPVALEGLKAGVSIINDVSGTPDKEMFKIVKDFNAQIVVMHTRGTPQTMQSMTDYTDLLGEIKEFLARKIDEAVSCGSYNWIDGNAYSSDTIVTLLRNDTVFVLELTVSNLPVDTLEAIQVTGHCYAEWNNKTWNTAGTYIDTIYATALGQCDSVVKVQITLAGNDSIDLIDDTVCGMYIAPWGDTLTESVNGNDVNVVYNGCTINVGEFYLIVNHMFLHLLNQY